MKSSAGRSKAGSGAAASSRAGTGGATSRAGASSRAASRRAAPGRPAFASPSTLIEAFERGTFPATLYLEGPCEPLKAALLAELRHAWAAHCTEAPQARVFRAAETTIEAILAVFQGASLFSPRDLLIVLDVEELGRSEKKITALAEGIARPSGPSSLVLVERAADTARKTLGPLRAACQVHLDAQAPRRAELVTWGARRFARERLEPDTGAVQALVDACEGDPLAFFGELEKLCGFVASPGPVTAADVATLLRPTVGADVGAYLAAVALGQSAAAAQRLGRLLAAGAAEGTVLFALSNLVGGALGGWARHRDLSLALARRRGRESLGRAVDAVYRAEAAWKGGRADAVAALEQATREVAGA